MVIFNFLLLSETQKASQFFFSPSYRYYYTDWQKLFVIFFIAALSACDQNRTYEYDIPYAFKPCPVEINSNIGFKQILWIYVEFCSSNTKSITPTTMPMTTKLGRVVTYHETLQPIKSYDPLITWYFEIMWQTKNVISPLPECQWPPHLAVL